MTDSHLDSFPDDTFSEDADMEEGLEPIAIVAMTGRFPGARTVAQFWENLINGVESVKFFTDEELADTSIDPSLLKNPKFVRADAILEDIDLFDAEFFGYNPREAEIMDPQHRLFMECAWEAMELAGYDPATYDGRVGVYAGANLSSYMLRNLVRNRKFVDSVGSFQTMLGNSQDFLSTKVSYKMDLKGPSVNTNTLCSSSMVGLHMGCQALWGYQIDMAMAGGVSIQVTRNEAMFYQEGGIGSFDGHCRAFDHRARGTVSGSGLGIVMLKRLEDAIAEGDTIHAVIRGSAINNDGGKKLSYTAPSIDGQSEVISEAMAVGGVHPETVTYIEAHGTGTSLGDPIEIGGLNKAFGEHTDKKQYCAVGSVKTNIGHLVTAGGVASLIKTVEALKHKQIPPSLNYEKPNPKIDFENSPFYVITEAQEWASEGPRRAGVSSFGIGGTNAHVVVEEAPEVEPSSYERDHHLILLSARSENALAQAGQNLADHLEGHQDAKMGDVAFTLQVGRKDFGHRHALICRDRNDALAQLKGESKAPSWAGFQETENRPVVFMFSGQGSQYVDMARGIYESESVFRDQVDACCGALAPHLDMDLRTLLFPAEADKEAAAQQLNQTAFTQPALFVIEYAMAKTWMAWGVEPKAMIGHSIGEYVAACLAGVLSLDDALSLVAARGRMIQNLPSGDMLAVSLPEVELKPILTPKLSLAAVNGPSRCVVSGEKEAVEAFAQTLKTKGVACSMLHTSHAFHSEMMQPIFDEFAALVAQKTLNAPSIPYVSNVTGAWITAEQARDPQYYAAHLRGTVRFSEGMETLFADSGQVLLEVGPGRTLATLSRQHKQKPKEMVIIDCIRHPKTQQVDEVFLLSAMARLWLAGGKIDWDAYHEDESPRRVPLPTYPFESRRFWIEPDMDFSSGDFGESSDDRLGIRKGQLADWFYVPQWRKTQPAIRPTEIQERLHWLLFLDEQGLGRKVANLLIDEGQHVVTVSVGEGFAKLEHGIFSLKPDDPAGYDTLLQELSQWHQIPHKIVSFWNLTDAAHESSNGELFDAAQSTGFYHLLYMAQAIARTGYGGELEMNVITNGLAEVSDQPIQPEKATIAGPLEVIPQECPNIKTRMIDVTYTAGDDWRATQMRDALIGELVDATREKAVALKGRSRWVRRYDPVKLESGKTARLRQDGVYLITGGLGNIGMIFAEHLAKTCKAKLALTTRSSFPAKADWPAWVARHGEDDETRGKIKRLQALEETGAQVLVLQADVADKNAMAQTLDRVTAEFGDLHGVIHAAGLFGREVFQSLEETTREHCDPQFNAKVKGLLVLDQLLENQPLDFCLLVSSLSSILGGLGLSGYAAANSFMDAFALSRNPTSAFPFISMSWDGWESNVQEDTGGVGASVADLSIKPEEGVEAFQRIVDHGGFDHVVISTEDLPSRIKWLQRGQDDVDDDQEYTVHPRPNLQNAFMAPRNEIEEKIAEVWQKRMGIEEVGIHDNYFDLGGDSLLVVKIRRALQDEFGMNLLTSDLFEHPTVAALAEFIGREKEEVNEEQISDRARMQLEAQQQEAEEMLNIRRRALHNG